MSFLLSPPSSRRLAVIGGGIAGLCAALRLQQNHWDVSLFAPKVGKGERASEAAVGISAVRGLVLAKSPLFEAKLQGHAQFPGFLREVERLSGQKIPCDEKGVFEFFTDLRQYQFLRKRIYHGEFSGCFSMSVLDRESFIKKSQITKNSIYQNSKILGSFYYPKDYFFSPKMFLTALESAFVNLGGKVYRQTAEAVTPHPDGGLELISSGFDAKKEVRYFAEVLLACGSKTPEFLKSITKINFPFIKIPGQTLVARMDFFEQEAYKTGRFGLVLQNNELRFGSLDHPKNSEFSEASLEQGKRVLQQKLVQDFFNHSQHQAVRQNLQAAQTEYGVRLALKDRLPLFGALPVFGGTRRLWLLTGFHKNGYDLAAPLASELAKAVSGKPVCAKMQAYFGLKRLFSDFEETKSADTAGSF